MTATPSPTVAVRGHWTAEVPPEVARIRVSVGARSGDRQQALRELGRRVEEARDALTGYSAAVESVEASPLWVHPQFRDGRPRERVTGYIEQGTKLGTLTPALRALEAGVTGAAA